MKKTILSIALAVSSVFSFSQTHGFYTIDVASDSLVFLDTLGNETPIGPTGRDLGWDCTALEFHKDTLYWLNGDSLLFININTGLATPLRRIYDVAYPTDTNTIWGPIAFDSHGHCYFHKEEVGVTQGYLYTLNIYTGAATRVSNNLSGNLSILGIEFDLTNNTLYASSEHSNKMFKYDTISGTIINYTSNNMGAPDAGQMEYDNNGVLYMWDKVSVSTSPSKDLMRVNTTTGIATSVFLFNKDYGGLAFYDGGGCTYYDTITTMVYDTTFTYDTLTTMVYDTTFIYTTITDTNLISVTDTLVINVVLTAIPAPNNINTINVYPNPAFDHITIDNGNYSNMGGYTAEVVNTLGQVVFQSTINQQQFYIDLNTWTGTGTYFISIIDPLSNTIDTRTIILQ